MAAREGWPMAQHSVDAGLGVSFGETAQTWRQATSHTGNSVQQPNWAPTPGAAKLDAVCFAWNTPSEAAALLLRLARHAHSLAMHV